MKWKIFKERVEKELKLIRPEAEPDEMDINRIDVFYSDEFDEQEVNVGTDLNNNIIVDS